MALNSLYPDGWFALGAAALKVTYVICYVLNSLFESFLFKYMRILLVLSKWEKSLYCNLQLIRNF